MRSLAVAALLCLTLSACGKHEGGAQAAVLVNGSSITAAEIQDKLRQYAHLPAVERNMVTGKLLKSSIDTELLRQAALKDKLDQDEAVIARLASANRLILANAYLEKQSRGITEPGEAEVKAIFEQHPAMYAERKIYDLLELVLDIHAENQAQVMEHLGDGKHLGQFIAWLEAAKMPVSRQPLTVPSDKVREEILEKLKVLKAGEATTVFENGKLTVIQVKGITPDPMTLAQARPVIAGKLMERRRTQSMEKVFADLRASAAIEYVAPYGANGLATPGHPPMPGQ